MKFMHESLQMTGKAMWQGSHPFFVKESKGSRLIEVDGHTAAFRSRCEELREFK